MTWKSSLAIVCCVHSKSLMWGPLCLFHKVFQEKSPKYIYNPPTCPPPMHCHSRWSRYRMWKWKLLMSDSLRPHGLYSPWNSSGQNSGVGSLSLLQGIFPSQVSNPHLPYCRQILYQLSHMGRYCIETDKTQILGLTSLICSNIIIH